MDTKVFTGIARDYKGCLQETASKRTAGSNVRNFWPEISDIRTAHAPNSLTLWLPITQVNCMKQMIKIQNRNVYNLVEKFAEVLRKF